MIPIYPSLGDPQSVNQILLPGRDVIPSAFCELRRYGIQIELSTIHFLAEGFAQGIDLMPQKVCRRWSQTQFRNLENAR